MTFYILNSAFCISRWLFRALPEISNFEVRIENEEAHPFLILHFEFRTSKFRPTFVTSTLPRTTRCGDLVLTGGPLEDEDPFALRAGVDVVAVERIEGDRRQFWRYATAPGVRASRDRSDC